MQEKQAFWMPQSVIFGFNAKVFCHIFVLIFAYLLHFLKAFHPSNYMSFSLVHCIITKPLSWRKYRLLKWFPPEGSIHIMNGSIKIWYSILWYFMLCYAMACPVTPRRAKHFVIYYLFIRSYSFLSFLKPGNGIFLFYRSCQSWLGFL